jgi:hypothetical protein
MLRRSMIFHPKRINRGHRRDSTKYNNKDEEVEGEPLSMMKDLILGIMSHIFTSIKTRS